MCGLPFHQGRCERPVAGTYWCTICLVTHLSAEDLAAPALPASLLAATGIERTTKWCQRCGAPVCGYHRHQGKEYVRCVVECRSRSDAQVASLRATTAKYNPGLPTEARCVVPECGVPSYRRAGRGGRPLCQRHYTQVRKGKTELTIERQRKWTGYRCKILAVALPPEDAKLAAELAGDTSVSKWVADLVRAEIRRRLDVETERITVFAIEQSETR